MYKLPRKSVRFREVFGLQVFVHKEFTVYTINVQMSNMV